ncbi:hypothetical protein DRQ20_05655, partial [bacterium]
SKVRKLIMIGTPNHEFSAGIWEFFYLTFGDDKDWQIHGEDVELGGGKNTEFTDLMTGEEKCWHDFLGYEKYIDGMACIAGTRKRLLVYKPPEWDSTGPNDGVVDTTQVFLNSADFNTKIYASHSHCEEKIICWYPIIKQIASSGEFSLTECTFTTEFIQKWMIDDEIISGASLVGFLTHLVPYQWDNYELRLRAGVDPYNEALVAVVYNKTADDARAFPLYKYGLNPVWKNPVYSMNHMDFPNGRNEVTIWIYDMVGLIEKVDTAFVNNRAGAPPSITLISPHPGDVFDAGDVISVEYEIEANYYPSDAEQYEIEYSCNGGNTFYGVIFPYTWYDSEEQKIKWVVSNMAADVPDQGVWFLKIIKKLDPLTVLYDYIDSSFSVNTWKPSNLSIYEIKEDEVTLRFVDNASNEDGFQLWRQDPGQSGFHVETYGSSVIGEGNLGYITDDKVERGNTYHYALKAFVEVDVPGYPPDNPLKVFSEPSNTINVYIPWLLKPTEFTISDISATTLLLTWRDNSRYNTGYEIEYKVEDGDWQFLTTVSDIEGSSGSMMSHTVNNLSPSTRYSFRVRAYDDEGHYSGWSNKDSCITHPYLTSREPDALRFNNSRKVAVAPDGTICLVHTCHGKVWYTQSQDGVNWEKEKKIGEGIYPAIAVDDNGTRWVVWWDEEDSLGIAWSDDGRRWEKDFLSHSFFNIYIKRHPSIVWSSLLRKVIVAVRDKKQEAHYHREIITLFTFDKEDILNSMVDVKEIEVGWTRISEGEPAVGFISLSSSNSYSPFLLYEKGDSLFRMDFPWEEWDTVALYAYHPCAGVREGVWEREEIEIEVGIYYGDELAGWAEGWAYPVVLEGSEVYVFWEWDGDIYCNARAQGSWIFMTFGEKIINTQETERSVHAVFSHDKKEIYLAYLEGEDVPYRIRFKKIDLSPSVSVLSPSLYDHNCRHWRIGYPLKITWEVYKSIAPVCSCVVYLHNLNAIPEGDIKRIGVVPVKDNTSPFDTLSLAFTWVPDEDPGEYEILINVYDALGKVGTATSDEFILTHDLVFNSSFEEGLCCWGEATDYGKVAIDSPGLYGDSCLRIEGDGSRWYWRVGQGGIPVVRGETYWLCGWIRTDFTQGRAKLVIGDYLGNSAHFDNLTGRTSWKYAYASFVPQNDSVRISAMIINYPQGRAWFDHFSLIKDT